MEKKSKVLKKWQVVVPKEIRQAAGVKVGDYLNWRYRKGRIEVIPQQRIKSPIDTLYGLIPSSKDAVEAVNTARRKRLEKLSA